MDCLNRYDYDRDKCRDFFQAYKDCKKTWVSASLTNSSALFAYLSRPRWNNAARTVVKGRTQGLTSKSDRSNVFSSSSSIVLEVVSRKAYQDAMSYNLRSVFSPASFSNSLL